MTKDDKSGCGERDPIAIWDDILDERGELEQPLRLFGLRTRRLELFLELVDCYRPITRPAEPFPKQCTRIHLRSILPQTQ